MSLEKLTPSDFRKLQEYVASSILKNQQSATPNQDTEQQKQPQQQVD
jgi:hypothetical protein